MWYSIIRLVLGALIFAILFMLIRRSKIAHKKRLSIIVLIIVAILSSLLSLVPVENCFVSFSSPQAAFEYEYSGKIEMTVNGEKSAMVLYTNNNAQSQAIFSKSKDGWKLGTYFSYKQLVEKYVNKKTVFVYKHMDSSDYYVMVWNPFEMEMLNISDNRGSSFVHPSPASKNAMYIAYVNNYGCDYQLKIDGETIELS